MTLCDGLVVSTGLARLDIARNMKGILVAVVFLQLVVLNEGVRWPKKPHRAFEIQKKRYRPEVLKSCPRNPKLVAMRKALGLETKLSGRRTKRSAGGFPVSCTHVAIIELDDGIQFLQPLHECCLVCNHPEYTICIFGGNPDWLCASRAHKCICDCRKTHVEDVEAEAVSKKKTSFRHKGSDLVCKKKTCSSGGSCCVQNQCIQLFVHKKKSPARP